MKELMDLYKEITDKLVKEDLQTKEVENYTKTCCSMIQLYAAKNHDYGDSFNKGMEAIGIAYAQGRLHDKFNRFMNLCKVEAKVKDESMIDTLKDLASYSIMLVNYLETH